MIKFFNSNNKIKSRSVVSQKSKLTSTKSLPKKRGANPIITARQRKRYSIYKRFTPVFNFFRLIFKSFKFKVFIVFVILLSFFLFIRSTNIFNIKTINVIAENQKSLDIITSLLGEYYNQNPFFVSNSKIINKIKESLPSTNTVFINKTLSGNLNVEVIEDIPTYYLVNNQAIYLLNQDSKVMEIIDLDFKVILDDIDNLILKNQLPIDSDQVRIEYSLLLPEENRLNFDWKNVPLEEKQKALDSLKLKTENKFVDFNTKLEQKLKDPIFNDLVGSFVNNEKKYSLLEKVDLFDLEFLSVSVDFFKSKGFVFKKAEWISDFSLKLTLESNLNILMSTKRPIQDQFTDLNTLIYYSQLQGSKTIDVRSKNYSVIN